MARTIDIKDALRDRYCSPEWATFLEVANGTGGHQRRYADAVSMNMYPSRGLEIHGFEIKISRSDWLRELKSPVKAESVFQYCDRWWLVAAENVLKDGELPVTWGHLEFKNGKLRQVTAAPKLAPVAIDRSFMAALMRRSGQVGDEELRAIIEKETAGIREREKNRVDREIERRTERAARLAKRADEIKELTGIDLESWVPAEDVAQAMRFAMAGDLFSKYGKFRSVMQDVDKLSGSMREAFATLLNLETVSE